MSSDSEQQTNSRSRGSKRCLILVGMVLGVAVFSGSQICAAKNGLGGTVTAGNSFYTVYVQDLAGAGVGQYTATTGAAHPAGEGLNVLYGYGNPGTSFNTIHSFTTGTDYIQLPGGGNRANGVVSLDSFGTVSALGTTGVRTTYVLPGPAATNATPDRLTIIQDVTVTGSGFDDSTVGVTTTLINNGSATVTLGVRYLWDYQIGNDDGPTFRVNNSTCSAATHETAYFSPTFDSYVIVDNDVNPAPPTFNIFGTVNGPASVTPLPTTPDLLEYVCWPNSFGTTFNYTVNPSLDIATAAGACQSGTGGGDSAVLYYFGHNASAALVIPAGGQQTVSASMFLTPPQPPPAPGPCVTRNSRFWFTHADTNTANCVTLKRAIQASCQGGVDLGFISLPTVPRYGNVTEPAELSLLEALGLYWRNVNRTGEIGGTQNSGLPGSSVCQARKQLAVELIAAQGNILVLGADPTVCASGSGKTLVNFPADLISQATQAATGSNVAQIKLLTALLRKFNSSGATNDFPTGLVECSPNKLTFLRQMARDPSTHYNCPGVNDTCASAEIVAFPLSDDPFALARFQRSVDMRKYSTGNAYWEITPVIGLAGRKFTVTAAKSNFASTLAVLEGQCTVVMSNGITTVDSSGLTVVNISVTSTNGSTTGSKVGFKTDGTNNFYIKASGGVGKLNLTLTSP